MLRNFFRHRVQIQKAGRDSLTDTWWTTIFNRVHTFTSQCSDPSNAVESRDPDVSVDAIMSTLLRSRNDD